MKKILFVDDDKLLLRTYMELFQEEGFECHCAENATEFGCFIHDQEFDAIVLDLHMPGIDGLTSIKRLAVSQQHKLKKILVVSGHLDEKTTHEMKELQVRSLRKPTQMADLLREVTQICSITE